MAASQVFNVTNVAIPATPPDVLIPNTNGVSVPSNKTNWTMLIDLGGTIPPGQTFAFVMEYQRAQWTDAAGILHPNGEWLPDVTAAVTTGPFTAKGGAITTLQSFTSSIGAVSAGGMVEPYPTHARLRLIQSGSWTIPSASLSVS